jgi:hypothetical protein
MNRNVMLCLPTALMAVMLVVAQGATVSVAQARDRSSAVSGPAGNSATRDVTRAKGQVDSSTTTSGGKTTSRDVDRSAGETKATVTGPKGQSVKRDTKYNKTPATTTSAASTQ